jgi:hypothetical protein
MFTQTQLSLSLSNFRFFSSSKLWIGRLYIMHLIIFKGTQMLRNFLHLMDINGARLFKRENTFHTKAKEMAL